jgi:hypothetical protein
MSSTHVTTRAGKHIAIISSADLHDPITRGERVRAFCHLHGGDHQRSLSIDPHTGWGYCFNAACHALVLVQDYNPEVAARLLHRHAPASTKIAGPPFSRPFSSESQEPRLSSTCRAMPSRRADWQEEERRALLTLAPLWQRALVSYDLGDCWQAQAYLHVRGIPLETAVEAEVGYFPAALLTHPDVAPSRPLLQRWVERLLFPLTSPAGRGYIGRSLWRWQLGMDEEVHKAILEQESAPRRWIKTNPAGWFCQPPVSWAAHMILVEGPFDRLALLSGGFDPCEVVALAGTAASSDWFPEQLQSLLLALDGDVAGQEASRRLAGKLASTRCLIESCSPPADGGGKDWSERWRKHGPDGLEPLYAHFSLLQHGL